MESVEVGKERGGGEAEGEREVAAGNVTQRAGPGRGDFQSGSSLPRHSLLAFSTACLPPKLAPLPPECPPP